MADAPGRLRAGAGAMLKFHVGAAMRTGDILPSHRAKTGGTFVAVARGPIETQRRERDHHQSEQRLLHGITRSGEAFFERVVERADVDMMTLRHHDQKRMQVGIVYARDVFVDLADDPALAAI
jgi:hypothetical protein